MTMNGAVLPIYGLLYSAAEEQGVALDNFLEQFRMIS